jgi:hypothetical protein
MIRQLTFAVLLVFICQGFVETQAQNKEILQDTPDKERRVYVDTHVTFMHIQNKYTFDAGVGTRAGYEIAKNVAVETEVNLFPENKVHAGGKKEQAFFRVRMGQRFGRIGLFAKAGSGFMIFSKGDSKFDFAGQNGCEANPNQSYCVTYTRTTNLVGELGGVLEFNTSKRTFIRFDAGNTMLSGGPYLNSFQTSSGFGFRF